MVRRSRSRSPVGVGSLDIRADGVVDFLVDPVALSVWDFLRGSRRAQSLSDVASALSRPAPQVQAALDRLVDLRLVAPRAARGRRSVPGYVVTQLSILVSHDPETDGALVDRVLSSAGDATRGGGAATAGPLHGRFVMSASLDESAQRELHRRIMAVVDYMRTLGAARSVASDDRQGGFTLLRTVIDVAHLDHGHPGHPAVVLLPRGAAREAGCVMNGINGPRAGNGSLTPRERDVATMLALGSRRAEIARQLGVSPHTVASTAKVVYRKLGVRSRLELGVRLRVDASAAM